MAEKRTVCRATKDDPLRFTLHRCRLPKGHKGEHSCGKRPTGLLLRVCGQQWERKAVR